MLEVLQVRLQHSHTDGDRAAVRGAGRTIRSNLDIMDQPANPVINRRSALHPDPQPVNVWAYKKSDSDAKNMVCVLLSSWLWFLSTMKPIFRQHLNRRLFKRFGFHTKKCLSDSIGSAGCK